MPPIPCKFWQQGTCRNGDNCRFEHVPMDRESGNRFKPLDPNGGGTGHQGQGNQAQNRAPSRLPFDLDKDIIITDLSYERPQWMLSAYGPGRFAPGQLFGGPLREQSPEEMRLLHYKGLASGNPQQAVQEAEAMVRAAEQQNQTALRDIDGAIDYIIKSRDDHPNRRDIVRDSMEGKLTVNPIATSIQVPTSNVFGGSSEPAQPLNPFGTSQTTPVPTPHTFGATGQSGIFGQPTALGANTNPFGTSPAPAFGGTSQLGTSTGVFGGPSISQNSNTPIGAPSGPRFGGPSQLGGGGTFGQPSVLGQSTSPFAPSSTPAAPVSKPLAPPINPFGSTPTTVAQPVFGGTSQPTATNPFGGPSQTATSNPYGGSTTTAPTWGKSSVLPSQPGLSGQPQPGPSNPFSSTPTTTLAVPPNPFGTAPAKPSQFGGTPVNSNPFGPSSTNPPSGVNLFATPVNGIQPGTSSALTPGTSSSQPFVYTFGIVAPTTTAPISAGFAPISSYSSKDANSQLKMFKGKRVVYKDGLPGFTNRKGEFTRIWFPDGPPAPIKDSQWKEEEYNDEIADAYMYLRQHGRLKDGIMPMLPPKREWCTFDF